MQSQIKMPKAEKIQTNADIVVVVDSTGSMYPCHEALKREIYTFIGGLQSAAKVNFRLRLIAYRDLHDPTNKGSEWTTTDFTSSVEEFISELDKVPADGGGDYRGSESGLDALYLALHSNWREHQTHRTIMFFTDDNSYSTMHPSTYSLPDNGIERIIQDFQVLNHGMLFLVCPRFPLYEQLQSAMNHADRKIVAMFVDDEDEAHVGLKNVDFTTALKMIGEQVSQGSVDVVKNWGQRHAAS